jgi:Alkylmercury lyase
MLLFRAEEHIDHWCAQWNQPRGATLTIPQAWQLARAWYQHKMNPDWRRATLEETEALLTELGLTGEFWNLRA